MKEQSQLSIVSQLPKLNKTRSGSQANTKKRVHQRGDKVVVNGAKQSLMAILRKYMCDCEKHNLEKTTSKFLALNKVSASYDLVVWILIFLRMNCEIGIYEEIGKEYLMKMNRKKDEDQKHHSPKYIQSKKITLKKFIQSAQSLLTDTISSIQINSSVSVLYSKRKSKDDAVKKINDYLRKVNHYFKVHDSLQFEETECSFMKKLSASSSQLISTAETIKHFDQKNNLMVDQDNEKKQLSSASQKQEDILSSSDSVEKEKQSFYKKSLTEKPVEEQKTMPKDQPNKSYRQNVDNESYDLFDELILDQSVDSPNSNYLFYFLN